jgi:Fe-S oxidoreductase
MFNAMENQENPRALAPATRGDWAAGLPVEVPVVDGSQPFDHEYLFWVGCAGSFDDRAKKVTIATAKLLQRAGVDFAILGPSERCTGDPARRSGNEYIFQMLAMQNVEALNGMGVKKIITLCPHCFNTLGNEYPQLDGHYEVVHHSQFLEFLLATNRLVLDDATLEERVVYHDSCYLGRHNDVYAAPRNVIGSLKGIQIVEAPRNGTTGMCCGAGGARMWMEESVGKKVNTERARELIATDAQRVATACPFCYIMLDDGVKEHGRDDVLVQDISMHLVDAIERGERNRAELGMPPARTEEGAADLPVGP